MALNEAEVGVLTGDVAGMGLLAAYVLVSSIVALAISVIPEARRQVISEREGIYQMAGTETDWMLHIEY